MKKTILLFFATIQILSVSCSREETMTELIDRVFDVAAAHSVAMASSLGPDQTPKTFLDDKLEVASPDWWCSGFFPGVLWYIYEYNSDPQIKDLAIRETAKVENIKKSTFF